MPKYYRNLEEVQDIDPHSLWVVNDDQPDYLVLVDDDQFVTEPFNSELFYSVESSKKE